MGDERVVPNAAPQHRRQSTVANNQLTTRARACRDRRVSNARAQAAGPAEAAAAHAHYKRQSARVRKAAQAQRNADQARIYYDMRRYC